MLQTTCGTRGGSIPHRVEAASSGSTLRTLGGEASRNVPCRVSDAPGGSVRRVSGNLNGLVLRCVVGTLCAALVASGCSKDGSAAGESVTTAIPTTTATPITAAPITAAPTTAAPTTAAPTTVTPTTAAPTTVTPGTVTPTTAQAANTTSPTSAPTTTAPAPDDGDPASEAEQILAAIERYYRVLVEANDPPDPNSPLWDSVAAPRRAAALRAKAAENLAADRGVRWPEDRQPLVHAPLTILRQDSIAVVNLCLRDSLETYDVNTGTVIDDSVSYSWAQLTVTDHFGPWLVSQYRTVQEFESQEPCIAAYQ